MHLHGAKGFTVDSPVQRYYRDCKILDYGEGANEVQVGASVRSLPTGVIALCRCCSR